MPNAEYVDLQAPPDVRHIVERLESQGFETWTVGGAVRDQIIGAASEDWDFATRARPSDVQAAFKRTVPVGIDHGTVGVLTRSGRLYEVTTFRRDVEPQGRRAIVRFSDSLADDLARRDFTFNALAWHPTSGELRDLHGGLDDLRSGVLRTVGTPAERFREDYLRILRALRFAGRLGLDIEADTWTALVEATPGLTVLSAERVREELMKVLGGQRGTVGSLSLYASSGALAARFPEFEALRGPPGDESADSDWVRALQVIAALPPSSALLRFAVLARAVSRAQGMDTVFGLMTRLKFSNADTDAVARWVAPELPLPEAGAPGAVSRRWLSQAGPSARGRWRLALATARAEANTAQKPTRSDAAVASVRALRRERDEGPPLRVQDLEVSGRDLIRAGVTPGPVIGRLLQRLLDLVLDDPAANARDRLLEQVQSLLAEGSEL